jgi:glucose/arabinose dehydrogenase/mono/diheme cytochrome c family protein
MRKKRTILAASLLLLGLAGAVARPYLASIWYLYQDVRLFPGSPAPPAEPEISLPLTNPTGTPWRFVDAFPGVSFEMPIVALFTKRGVYVLERMGRVWRVALENGAYSKKLLLDLTEEVGELKGEQGAVGLALHPEFGQPTENGRFIYLYYTSQRQTPRYFDRLERYAFDDGYQTIKRESMLRLIDQLDEHTDHNGGDIHFGADGFLYLSVGDEGALELKNSQRINKDLFGGLLRIDVDRKGGTVSHPPRRPPETGKTQGYFIPNDNPFVGVENALEEFWSIGLRNPYRFTIDRATQRVIGGDVGRLRMESVFEAHKGSNHRWSFYEGTLPHPWVEGDRPKTIWGRQTEPLFAYMHQNMNQAIIGGLIYHGRALGSLEGKYIYGDNCSGRVWALNLDTKDNVHLATVEGRGDEGLAGFAEDDDGEVYAITLGWGATGGRIEKLVPKDTDSEARTGIPKKLSEVGFFTDTTNLRAHARALEYSINLPMWHGVRGLLQRNWALQLRFKSAVTFAATMDWTTPGGLVFVKHFDLDGRKLETQFLVTSEEHDGYGFSYKWNDAGTEAFLVEKGEDVELRQGRWRFSASDECAPCHNKTSGFVLGLNTRQLNRGNQLVELRKQGFFQPRSAFSERIWGPLHPIEWAKELRALHDALTSDPLVQPSRVAGYPKLAGPAGDASLDFRVRSYMDVNCSHCHRPGGSGGGRFDARFSVPLADKSFIGRPAQRPIDEANLLIAPKDPKRSLVLKRISSGVLGTQMPPLGVSAPNDEATQMFREWIDTL